MRAKPDRPEKEKMAGRSQRKQKPNDWSRAVPGQLPPAPGPGGETYFPYTGA